MDPVTLATSKRYANRITAPPKAQTPLSIPTYDDAANVGHPDVVLIPEGWNGYRYWMAFTPYPDQDRENPSVVASNDGVEWVVPAGLTNPIVPLSEATDLDYVHNSDADLVYDEANDLLAMYYRHVGGTPNEGIYRKTSSDGVTWSSGVACVLNTDAATTKILSPAVVIEADNTWSMWSVNDEVATASKVEKRTSADGVTWSAPATVTTPYVSSADPVPWHIDVVLGGDGKYHALMASQSPFLLYYWQSDDGDTWTGGGAIPRSGEAWDAKGIYRSTFVQVPGLSNTFDLWVTGVANDNANLFAASWRLALYRGVDLSVGFPQREQVFIPAQALTAGIGSPASSVFSSRYLVWSLDASSVESLLAFQPALRSWYRTRVKLLWTNMSSGSGDVRWQVVMAPVIEGENMSSTSGANLFATATAPAQSVLSVTDMGALPLVANTLQQTTALHVRVLRVANDAADTLANDAGLFGVLLEPA